jgi:hypothetical protein
MPSFVQIGNHKLGGIIFVMNFMLSHWPFLIDVVPNNWNTTCMSVVGACFAIHHLLTWLSLEGLQVLHHIIFLSPNVLLLHSCGPHLVAMLPSTGAYLMGVGIF